MVSGATRIKIHGNYYPMRAEVCSLDMLSAHADESEILDWLGQFSQPPQETFITHGEAAASDALRRRIEETLDWTCVVPEHGETRVLG
jgi:metallo-beta-lactamase family protein